MLNGGAGNNTVILDGDYSTALRLQNSTLENIQIIRLVTGFSYDLTMASGTVAAGQTMTVNGSTLGTTNSMTINGSNEASGQFDFIAGAGTDDLTGGGGNDTFEMGGNLTAADRINGEGGNNTVVLDGNYSTLLHLSGPTLTNIQTIRLAAGYDYDLTLADSNVAPGQTMTVDGSALGATDSFIFSGINIGNGQLVVIGGAGTDDLSGGYGNDIFEMGGNLTAADRINGEGGNNTVILDGDYSAGLTFKAATMVNVETLSLTAGYSYKLVTNDATVAAGQTLTIDGSALGTANSMSINGSNETNGQFIFIAGAGTDDLTGGAGNDVFDMGGNLTAADRINGEGGYNTLALDGNYSTALHLSGSTLSNIQTISFAAGYNYDLILADANVATGQTMTVDGSALGAANSLTFSGVNVGNGQLVVIGGAGDDTLTGGADGSILDGGGGADKLTAYAGENTFVYNAISDSTSSNFDTVVGFDALLDKFQVLSTVTGIDSEVVGGTLSTASFDTDLVSALSGHLLADHAILFEPTSGTFKGQTFLVIDQNGQAGYQAGGDLVIDLTHTQNLASLSTTDFTI